MESVIAAGMIEARLSSMSELPLSDSHSRRLHPAKLLRALLAQHHTEPWESQQQQRVLSPTAAGTTAPSLVRLSLSSPLPSPAEPSSAVAVPPSVASLPPPSAPITASVVQAVTLVASAAHPAGTRASATIPSAPSPTAPQGEAVVRASQSRKRTKLTANRRSTSDDGQRVQRERSAAEAGPVDAEGSLNGSMEESGMEASILRTSPLPSKRAVSATVLSAAYANSQSAAIPSTSSSLLPAPLNDAISPSTSAIDSTSPPPVVVRSYAKLNNLLCCRHVCGCLRSKFDCRKGLPPQLEQHLKEQYRDKCVRDRMRVQGVGRVEAEEQLGSMDFLQQVAVIKRASRMQHEQNAALHRCGQQSDEHFSCSHLLKRSRAAAATPTAAADIERDFDAAVIGPAASEPEPLLPPSDDGYELVSEELQDERAVFERLFTRPSLFCSLPASRGGLDTTQSAAAIKRADNATERVVLVSDGVLRRVHATGAPLPFVDLSPDCGATQSHLLNGSSSTTAVPHSLQQSHHRWNRPAHHHSALVHIATPSITLPQPTDTDARQPASGRAASTTPHAAEHDSTGTDYDKLPCAGTHPIRSAPVSSVREFFLRLASVPSPSLSPASAADYRVEAEDGWMSCSTVQYDTTPPPAPAVSPASADTFDLFRLVHKLHSTLTEQTSLPSWALRRTVHSAGDYRSLAASPFFASTSHSVQSGRLAWVVVDRSAERLVHSVLLSRTAGQLEGAVLPPSDSPLLFMLHAQSVLIDPLLFALNSERVGIVLQGDGQSASFLHDGRSLLCAVVLGAQPCVVLDQPLLPAKQWLEHGLPSCEQWLVWAAASLPLCRDSPLLRAASVAAVRRMFPQPLTTQLFTAIARQVTQPDWSISLSSDARLSAAGRLLRCCILRENIDELLAQSDA